MLVFAPPTYCYAHALAKLRLGPGRQPHKSNRAARPKQRDFGNFVSERLNFPNRCKMDAMNFQIPSSDEEDVCQEDEDHKNGERDEDSWDEETGM